MATSKFNRSIKNIVDDNARQFFTIAVNLLEDEYIETTAKVIEDTPRGIPNSERSKSAPRRGNTRFNWQIGKRPSDRILRGAGSKGKDYTEKQIRGKLIKGGSLFFFNNTPQASVLEFGGYPQSVKKGTYRRGKGYEIRSSGGYSRQAPKGMLRLNFLNFTKRYARKVNSQWGKVR